MKTKTNLKGINWKKEQDVVIARKLNLTRERVRQIRMDRYFAALRRALALLEKEGEQDVRAVLAHGLEQTGARRTRILKGIASMELDLNSPLRKALASASSIYRPSGWHGRESDIRNTISKLNTKNMTVKEIAGIAGCGVSYVSQILRNLGKVCLKAHQGKELYDWSRLFPYKDGRVEKGGNGLWVGMKDEEIAEVLGVKNPMVVTCYRWRNGFRRRMEPLKKRRMGRRAGLVV